MNEEIREILNKFDGCLENYEHDKVFGQLSVESICHLFPISQQTLKDYIIDLQQKNKRLNNLIDSTTQLYLKELSEKGKVDDLACKMFNTLEENIK